MQNKKVPWLSLTTLYFLFFPDFPSQWEPCYIKCMQEVIIVFARSFVLNNISCCFQNIQSFSRWMMFWTTFITTWTGPGLSRWYIYWFNFQSTILMNILSSIIYEELSLSTTRMSDTGQWQSLSNLMGWGVKINPGRRKSGSSEFHILLTSLCLVSVIDL